MSVTFISHKQDVLDAVQKAIDRGLEICGGMAESYAKRLCPVDTGRLRNSITHQQYDEKTEVIGTNVSYAVYQENGTWKVKPKHFLRRAAENHANEYKAVLQNELAKVK